MRIHLRDIIFAGQDVSVSAVARQLAVLYFYSLFLNENKAVLLTILSHIFSQNSTLFSFRKTDFIQACYPPRARALPTQPNRPAYFNFTQT